MDRGRPKELINEDVEDDDMPPVVDKPGPSSNYTFLLDTASPSLANTDSSQVIPSQIAIPSTSSNTSTTERQATMTLDHSSHSPPPTSPEGQQPMASTSTSRPRSKSTRGGRGKSRHTSVPRPPNSFILFRSAFIRSEQIPDKVEGNHNKLSKIAGFYWKTLSKEEKAPWEAEAVMALEKHRQTHPDWRFRPAPYSTDAPKAKGARGSKTSRRRKTVSKDAEAGADVDDAADEKSTEGRPSKSAKSKGKEKEKDSSRSAGEVDERCARIAELLKQGKKGPQLALAVEEWYDDMSKGDTAPFDMNSPSMDDRSEFSPQSIGTSSKASSPDRHSAASNPAASPARSPASQSPASVSFAADSMQPQSSALVHHSNAPRGLSAVPLTHMFTRPPHPTHLPPNPPVADPCPRTQYNLQLTPISSHTSFQPRHADEALHTSPVGSLYPQQSGWRPQEVVSFNSQASPSHEPSPYWQWDPPLSSEPSEASSEKPCGEPIPQREMGYDTDATVMGYDSYGKHFGSGDLPNDGSEVTSWTTSSGRHGFTAVVDDPLDNPPSLLPGTFTFGSNVDPSSHHTSQQALSSNYYYPPSSQAPSTMPSSSTSFSTLSGWAGDYSFQRDSNLRNQFSDSGSSDYSSSSKLPSSGGWYPQQAQWQAPSREDHGMGMALSADDWDAMDAEYDPRTH